MSPEDRRALLDLFKGLEERSGERLVTGSTAAFPDIKRPNKSMTWKRAARLSEEALNLTRSREGLVEFERFFQDAAYEDECEQIYAKYLALTGTIVRGLVQRTVYKTSRLYDFGGGRLLEGDEVLCRRQKLVIVALEYEVEAVLPVEECLRDDHFAINDFVDAEIIGVYKSPHGPVIVLSRARSSFLRLIREQSFA